MHTQMSANTGMTPITMISAMVVAEMLPYVSVKEYRGARWAMVDMVLCRSNDGGCRSSGNGDLMGNGDLICKSRRLQQVLEWI